MQLRKYLYWTHNDGHVIPVGSVDRSGWSNTATLFVRSSASVHSMDNHNKVSIFTKFSPYLRLVRVFDAGNFRKNDNWRYMLQKIVCSIFVITLICSMSITLTLMVWNLLEIDGDAKTLVVSMPLMMSLTQVFVTFLVLIRENGAIAEATERIQSHVNRRKGLVVPVTFTNFI